MERFTEQTAADFAANQARHMAAHIWGDEIPDQRCDICGEFFIQAALQIVDDDTPLPLFLCETCASERTEASQEPECECHQTDVDLFDARGCEAHDPSSPWNVRKRAAGTAVQLYSSYGVA